MARKKKTDTDSEYVTVSKEELERLTELARKHADTTESLDDDEFLDDFEDNISDMGDSMDEKDDRRWELDENPIIDRIRHELRRELLNAQGHWYRPKDVKPVVNRMGEHDILGLLRSNLTKNLAMGNISRSEAHIFARDTVAAFIRMIANNWRKWELDKSYRDWLVALIDHHVYLHFTRPINEGERKYRGGSIHSQDGFDDDLYSKRDPFMEGMSRKGKTPYFEKDDGVLNI